MHVHKTTDYNKFVIKYNRPINGANVNALIRSFKDSPDSMKVCPIIVAPSMVVIDGQHRIEAARRMQVPIHYCIDESATDTEKILSRIKSLNVQRPWEVPDFIHYYAEQKIPDYQFLLKTQEKYKSFITFYSLIYICETEFPKQAKATQIRDGKFTAKNQKKILEFLEECRQHLECYQENIKSRLKSHIFNRIYTKALYDLHRGEWKETWVSVKNFLKNCNKYPAALPIPFDHDQAKKYIIQMARHKEKKSK